MSLTENQIRWCRTHINAFDLAWRSVKAADEHKAKVYEKMGVEPGKVQTQQEGQGQ